MKTKQACFLSLSFLKVKPPAMGKRATPKRGARFGVARFPIAGGFSY